MCTGDAVFNDIYLYIYIYRYTVYLFPPLFDFNFKKIPRVPDVCIRVCKVINILSLEKRTKIQVDIRFKLKLNESIRKTSNPILIINFINQAC